MREDAGTVKTWLQIFRAPNLFTVPGDPIAGWLLASHGLTSVPFSILFPILATLCFYCAGLSLNDLVDLEEDRIDRPTRPLPSGKAMPGTVFLATMILIMAGLFLCWCASYSALVIGAILTAAIITYNCCVKQSPFFGPLLMGACRGLSLMLGATASGGRIAILALGGSMIVALYIAAITALARHETKPDVPDLSKWFPLCALIPCPILLVLWSKNPAFALLLISPALVVATRCAIYLRRQPGAPLPPLIGSLIRGVIFVQATFCVTGGTRPANVASALLLIALWPASCMIGKRFYSS